MKLYLISQSVNNGYDTYDSAVVAAPDEDAARLMHPGDVYNSLNTWCNPSDVQVKYLGETDEPQSVICASFNAG